MYELHQDIKNLYESGLYPVDIAKKLNKHLTSVKRILIKYYKELRVESKSSINNILFENLKNRDVNYFLGLLATDGCIVNSRITLSLHEKDLDIIVKYKDFLKTKNKIAYQKHTKFNSTQVRISVRNKTVTQRLISYGITSKKSETLCLSIPITWDMFRGFVDGDGSISGINKNKGCRIQIATISEKFKDQIQEFLKLNKIDFKTYKSKNIYQITIHKDSEVLKCFDNMYKDTETYIKRKFHSATLYRNILENKPLKFRENVSTTLSEIY